MQKSKKNGVGPVAVWLLLGGVNNWVSNDSNARTAVFSLPEMTLVKNWIIALYGLRSG